MDSYKHQKNQIDLQNILAIVDYKYQIAWIKDKDNVSKNDENENKIEDNGAAACNVDRIARATDTGENGSKPNDTNELLLDWRKKDKKKKNKKNM